jgi:transposase
VIRTAALVFRGKSGKLIKILWHDGQHVAVCQAVGRGWFIWPSSIGGAVVITPAQLGYMLEGIDWRNRSGVAAKSAG